MADGNKELVGRGQAWTILAALVGMVVLTGLALRVAYDPVSFELGAVPWIRISLVLALITLLSAIGPIGLSVLHAFLVVPFAYLLLIPWASASDGVYVQHFQLGLYIVMATHYLGHRVIVFAIEEWLG